MLHRVVLVLTLLVVASCTGDDTVRVDVFCPTLDRVLMEDETCPDPPPVVAPPTTPVTPPTTPDPGTDRGDSTRSDCNIQVTIVTSDMDGERFEGTPGDDIICGNERNDVIDAKRGDDTIFGGTGNDILIGGEDRDVLRGEAGNDVLRGGPDDDVLDGGGGTDTADYSKENDRFEDENDRVGVVVDLAEGQATDTYGDEDTLIEIENVIGTPVSDTIIGDKKDNEIDGYGGDDMLDGGAGSDTIVVDGEFTLDATSPGSLNFENIRGKRCNSFGTHRR